MLDVRVFGHSEFYTGSKASLRIVTADFKTDQAIAGAEVAISLLKTKTGEARPLGQGKTNSQGTLNTSFHIPELPDGKYELQVSARTAIEEGKVKFPVTFKEAYAIYVTSDKPLYQPSQTMHIRALVLRKCDLKPLTEKTALIEIEDSKGNKVFKKKAPLSRFGLISTTFTLADEINTGLYTIRVEAEKAREEKKVTVDRYVLPKFKVACELDKDFYFPRETVTGKINSEYFFGKPVAGARVEVKASTFEVAFREFTAWQGKTDAEGGCQFEIPLPGYFIGQPLVKGKGLVKFDIKVTDTADHAEKKTVNTTVSEGSLVVNAFPEGGRIVGGLENTVFVATTYPDGTPAMCDVMCTFIPPPADKKAPQVTHVIKSGEVGIGRVTFEPAGAGAKYRCKVSAVDDRGNKAERTFDLSVAPEEDGILIHPDKSIYKVGETMDLSILSTRPDAFVYIDIVKNSQTVLTQSCELQGAMGTFSVDLSPDLFGLLEIHVYQMRKSLNIVRDAKRVFVNRADDLSIEITLDKKQYLPAEKAVLDVRVKDAAGHPVLAALGLYIVDEAVFALSELQPGLEKVFFMLEKEILTPQYQIRGITSNILLGSFPRDIHEITRKQEAARVLFAAITPPPSMPVAQSSRAEEMKKMMAAAQKKIWAAVQARGKAKKAWITNDFSLLVKEEYLKAEDLLDPWGRPYARTGCTCNSCRQRFLSLVSCGPDGKSGTSDDIRILHGGKVEDKWVRRGAPGMAGFGRFRGRGEVDAVMAPMAEKADLAADTAEMPMNAAAKKKPQSRQNGQAAGKPPVRIREYFPETLFVRPQVITDAQGYARQAVDLADSITSWRLSAFASSPGGGLGSTTHPIRVFQDFFVDIDFPVTLTQNDEVSVPIAVYNYLKTPQEVRLVAEPKSWFTFLAGAEKIVALKPNEVTAVYFPIRVKELGHQKFLVKAHGTEMSDALQRVVEVVPDGKRFEAVINGRLLEKVEHNVTIPEAGIKGSEKLFIKFYPGVVCQLLEGMDGLLRLPGG